MSVSEALASAGRAAKGPSREKRGGRSPVSSLARVNVIGTSYRHLDQYRHYKGYTYSIVRVIATRVCGQQLKVGRRVQPGKKAHFASRPRYGSLPSWLKGKEDQLHLYRKHPILDCFENPNPVMVRWVVMFCTVASIQITGKGYWWMTRNEQTGNPEIWPLPSHWVEPVHTEEKLFDSWRVQPDSGAAFNVKPEELVYFYLPDISDPLNAYGPADAMRTTISVDEQTEETQRRSLLNSVNPALAITVGRSSESSPIGSMTDSPVLTRSQRKTLKAGLRQEYQGMLNADEPMILDGFIKDVKPLRTSPREIDFMNSSDAVKARLAQGWGVNPIVMGQVEGANRACHDTETELLTKRGWLKYSDIRVGDMAGSINPDTGRFEWSRVSKVHIYDDYDGEMIRLSGQKVDALLTPNHRMWVRKGRQEGTSVTDKDSVYGFKMAGDLKCHDVIPLAPLPSLGERQEEFYLPPAFTNDRIPREYPGLMINMDAMTEFVGWFISEGWTSVVNKSHHSYTIGIKQAVGNAEECRRIHACMKAINVRKVFVSKRKAVAGIDTADGYDRQETNTYLMSDKRLNQWLRSNCGIGSHNKKIPDFVFGLPAEQSDRVVEAMLLGDGSHRKSSLRKNYSSLHAMYASTSPVLMDQFQALCLMCGRSARMRKTMPTGVHTMGVSEYSREMSLLPKHISREKYTGTVWCATVDSGLMITRRNGKPLISGNSSAVAEDHVLNNVVNPLMVLMSEVMTKMMPAFFTGRDDEVVYLEPAKSNDADYELAFEEMMMDRQGVTINEVRVRHGMPPIKGGDRLATGPTTNEIPADPTAGVRDDDETDDDPGKPQAPPEDGNKGRLPRGSVAKGMGEK
ncbi:MAG: phage portal protein, partial [Fimbriiglobus sp.]